jgi:hypothetical protein
MTALSIRYMRMTLARREQEGIMSAPSKEREESRYYFVERKAKRRKDKWIVVRSFWSTPARAEEFFNTNYQDGQHRLREIISPAASQQ